MICPKCGVFVTSENSKCRNCGCNLENVVDTEEKIYDLNEQKRRANSRKYEIQAKRHANYSYGKSTSFKKMRFYIISGVILILLAATNPTRAEYVSWIKDHIMNQTTNELQKGLITVFADVYIQSATTRSNYIIFSIYKTHRDDSSYVKTVGILRNFIPIQSSSNNK